ncbi:MAG: DUF58 domain-containing protein [Oscillochloris sp.]|nr:DUF58 domain-containing protein [Oscillochloris sp.]
MMRRKGQSLDFREHVAYQLGEDVRFVDWRASARHGQEHDLVVRNFVAEEQLKLLISVDTRPTMALPEPEHERTSGMSKLLIARWLAEALARVALDGGDSVALHHLFDETQRPPQAVAGEQELRRAITALTPADQEQSPANLRRLQPFLPPTAVWVIVTDCYFEFTTDVRRLSATVAQAQAGMCWVLLVELDSWPYESADLGSDVWQVPLFGSGAEVTIQLGSDQPGAENRRAIEAEIERNRSQFIKATRLADLDHRHWIWPRETVANPLQFFTHQLLADRHLQSMFVKQTL